MVLSTLISAWTICLYGHQVLLLQHQSTLHSRHGSYGICLLVFTAMIKGLYNGEIHMIYCPAGSKVLGALLATGVYNIQYTMICLKYLC